MTISNTLPRSVRKVPLLKKAHVQARLMFANKHLGDSELGWENVLWSDESKIELFGINSTCRVWRKIKADLDPKNTISTIKHGGGNIMLWGCFSAMKGQDDYTGSREKWMWPSTGKSWVKTLPQPELFWWFVDGYSSMTMTQSIRPKKVDQETHEGNEVALNLLENLWSELKIRVAQRQPTNLKDLERINKEEWAKIHPLESVKTTGNVSQLCLPKGFLHQVLSYIFLWGEIVIFSIK